MTVCTASLFYWHYGKDNVGPAIVAASDRMLTDEGLGIEFESSRWKGVGIESKRLVLVAGDLAVHSEVLQRLSTIWEAQPPIHTFDVAERAAKVILEYKIQQAERIFLEPLSLTRDSFLDRKITMTPSLVMDLANQLQKYRLDVEALVLGCDGQNSAGLYRINEAGIVTNHTDIGFVSIGNGGIHSSAHFMMESYTHATTYLRALYQTFKAKKRAEVAPGVGPHTDMMLINRVGAILVDRPIIEILEEIHAEDLARAKKLPEEAEERLRSALEKIRPSQPEQPS